MIYLAPIQGFTDFIYRKAFSEVFTAVDAFFIPYVSVKNNEILKKYKKEILPENNLQTKVIPQILVKDETEILFLTKYLNDFGYKEINLNLGCPYPMVTKRQKGAGLLPHPEKIRILLETFYKNSDLKLSVKLRAGLISEKEIEKLIPVLNEYPLTEVIFHPRIAQQLYSGEINNLAFQNAAENLNHNLVYNGDIFSIDDFNNRIQQFPQIKNLMLGRGVLMNPFLPAEINQIEISENKKVEKLKEFHRLILEGYSENMDNEGNVVNKMKQFWSYFSFVFPNQKKTFKTIRKTKKISDLQSKAQTMFLELY